jgi:hypothetical protein
LGAHGFEYGRGEISSRAYFMEELVAFFDGRRQISNVELEPVITSRANKKSCLFSCFFDDIIEIFISYIR